MKLAQLNIFKSAVKNQATANAARHTFNQAKTECREWSKLSMAVANLAAEISQEISRNMNLPAQRNPSDGNPFTQLAHDQVAQMDSVSSNFKKLSDETRGYKRQIAGMIGEDKATKAYSVGLSAAAIGAAVPTFGGSLVGLAAPLATSKLSKENFLKSGGNLIEQIYDTMESEPIKSLDSLISQMEHIVSSYAIPSETIMDLFHTVTITKAQLDDPEISPFTHKTKESTQKHNELRKELTENYYQGNGYENNRSLMSFALNDVKQSENYKPVLLKGSRKNNPDHLKSDMDHFFAKIEKRKIKTYIQYEQSHKTTPHFSSGLNPDNLI